MRLSRALPYPVILLFVLAGCGDEPEPGRPAIGPYRVPGPGGAGSANVHVAQEVWVTYGEKAKELFPMRPPRTRDEARTLAEALRARVLKGEDIGLLAQTASDSRQARADGYSGRLAKDRDHLDERDRAIMAVREGELTPIVEWSGGWWFARRIDLATAVRLEKTGDDIAAQAKAAQHYRVRARLIHFHHAEAWPDRFEADGISKEQALGNARKTLRELKEGADFAVLADKYSWDESGDRGGVLLAWDALGKRSPWITRWDTGYTETLLRILFDPSTPPGIYPQPIDTLRGVHVVELLERRQVTPDELERSRVPAPAQAPKERTPR